MALPDTIKELRERAGLSMAGAAKLGGWSSASSYQRYEDPTRFRRAFLPMDIAQRLIKAFVGKGSPQIEARELLALTQPLGAPSVTAASEAKFIEVIAVVEAGVWREAVELPVEDRKQIPAPYLPGFEDADVFALQVRGQSMNMVYPEGSIAFFVRPEDLTPAEGHIVVVVSKRGDLYETTLKELGRDNKGKVALYPRSTDPRHQTPIYPNKVGAESVEVIGVAIGKFEMLTGPSRAR